MQPDRIAEIASNTRAIERFAFATWALLLVQPIFLGTAISVLVDIRSELRALRSQQASVCDVDADSVERQADPELPMAQPVVDEGLESPQEAGLTTLLIARDRVLPQVFRVPEPPLESLPHSEASK